MWKLPITGCCNTGPYSVVQILIAFSKCAPFLRAVIQTNSHVYVLYPYEHTYIHIYIDIRTSTYIYIYICNSCVFTYMHKDVCISDVPWVSTANLKQEDIVAPELSPAHSTGAFSGGKRWENAYCRGLSIYQNYDLICSA